MTNVALKILTASATFAVAAAAYPVDYLINGGFENPDPGGYYGGGIQGWIGQGEGAPHANHATPGNGTLGTGFGYYTPRDNNNTSVFRQDIGITPLPGAKYNFRSWAFGGGNALGTAIYQIGFLIGGGFIDLATRTYEVKATSWQSFAGVTWIAPQQRLANDLLVVQFGPALFNGKGDNSDLWVDKSEFLEDLQPSTGILSGTLTLEDFAPADDQAYLETIRTPIQFELVDPLGNIAETVLTTLDNDNKFLIWTNLRGEYSLRAKARTWLSQSIPVSVTNAGVSGLNYSLANGDIDGDDMVTVFDYDKLSAYFDATNTGYMFWNMQDAEGNARRDADLDKDGAVTVFDYDVLSKNFDRSGS